MYLYIERYLNSKNITAQEKKTQQNICTTSSIDMSKQLINQNRSFRKENVINTALTQF